MISSQFYRSLSAVMFALVVAIFATSYALVAQESTQFVDDLEQETDWALPTKSKLVTGLQSWATEAGVSEEEFGPIREFVERDFESRRNDVTGLVVEAFAIQRDDIASMLRELSGQRQESHRPDFSHLIDNPEEPPFFSNHLKLYLGRWLAQNQFFDEALELLQSVSVQQVHDPAALLFYRGLMEHQLLRKDECVETTNRLLQHSGKIPRRYEVLSRLVLADIEPLEEGSLDEISRLMGDIERRTGLHRSGRKVIAQEVEVIKKLDKLIETLEAQQQQQSPSGGSRPSNPMEDSQIAGGQGSGEVIRKRLVDGGDWGNLPPAQRAAALAEMAKDMPPHYREVIEAYFRKLAREDD